VNHRKISEASEVFLAADYLYQLQTDPDRIKKVALGKAAKRWGLSDIQARRIVKAKKIAAQDMIQKMGLETVMYYVVALNYKGAAPRRKSVKA
jgi:hypothetical protein